MSEGTKLAILIAAGLVIVTVWAVLLLGPVVTLGEGS